MKRENNNRDKYIGMFDHKKYFDDHKLFYTRAQLLNGNLNFASSLIITFNRLFV